MQQIDSVLKLPSSVDPGTSRSFRTSAETDLAAIRSGLLIFLQDRRSTNDLDMPADGLRSLKMRAGAAGLDGIAALSAECEQILTSIPDGEISLAEQSSQRVLDLIAKMEAELLSYPLEDDDLNFSISGFLDESFDKLMNSSADEPLVEPLQTDENFEIDEETMDIFRSEASELLENISINLQVLNAKPDDLDALWNIRRCAHTFKGAAGVIGLKEASELAHRVEDLLDQLAERQQSATVSVIDLLNASTGYLNDMTLGCGRKEHSKTLDAIYDDFDRVVSENSAEPLDRVAVETYGLPPPVNSAFHESTANTVKPPPAPIVRVALDKLDELLNLTRNLAVNRSALAHTLGELSKNAGENSFDSAALLFETQRQLTSELQEKLLQIRMVRFGMLTTRLNRAVHVTCQEEDKRAALTIENENSEVDTQILDSLVEPLLHLLRNAVVHGIEPPERRRLIGKPEKGQIRISVESEQDKVVISVEDDGRGISLAKLRENAVSSGVIDAAAANSLTDPEALDLVFLRGLTTADKLSMNAGRGVGMSIVRESIGSIGGSISIASESQKGTTFTIKIPLVPEAANENEGQLVHQSSLPQPTSQTKELNILVVDDSSSVRQMIKRMVEDEGWNCTTAIDGINAAEILGVPENRPDMILTDLEMPNLDGYELLELLKNDVELCEIPVVMVTSRSGQAHREKALDLGAADFITKPFQAKTLIKIIEQHCGCPKV
ncbi:MAG: response regulator [Chloracidobacterium sp.]|nr:response regulator [Chloracidobacterium sp.]